MKIRAEHNLGVEESEQKSEERKPKSVEGKKKRISRPSSQTLRQWQTFILATIIIAAYVVFFAYIISTAPVTKVDNADVRNYDGMTTLAGTFGVIAAAVVGYYFGTRNLEQATNMAVEAKKEADESKVNEEEAKKEADEKKNELKKEAKKGIEYYKTMEKVTDPAKKEKTLDQIVKGNDIKQENVDDLHKYIRKRRETLEARYLGDLSSKMEEEE
jgi:hypothetical protein